MTRSASNDNLSRRTFLTRMGLRAASAPLVLGIGHALIGRALGQNIARRMALFFVHGESFVAETADGGYTPPGIASLTGRTKFNGPYGPDVDNAGVPWPDFLAPLAPFKQKMAIVDGLTMDGVQYANVQHGWKFASLSACGSAESPSGMSLDQHVSSAITGTAPLGSLLFGDGGRSGTTDAATGTFSSGPGAGLEHLRRPSALLARLTGKSPALPSSGPASKVLLDARLLDLVREDLRRLDRGLASEEKAKLGEYLASIEGFQKKEAALAAALKSGTCSFPASAATGSGAQNLGAMFGLAAIALRCGVTNVVGVTTGNTSEHDDMKFVDGSYSGHGNNGVIYRDWLRKFAPTSMGWVANLLTALGPLAANLTVVIVPANGICYEDSHHGGKAMAAVVYDGSGALRTGSRFIRRYRHIADLYATVATALGAPARKFNGAGTGPIAELLG